MIDDAIARAGRNTLSDAIRRAAARFRDREALVFGDRAWSFRAIDDATSRVAGRLIAAGLRPGDRVAAYGRNSDAYLIAFLACCRAGMVHVPVNYALTGGELRYILDQSGARALLTAPALEANLDGIEVEIRGRFDGGGGLDILATALDPAGAPDVDAPIDDASLAQIVYTSGTTAAPKGAMMTHRAMMSQYYSVIHEMDYSRR
jgi:fatty-acyl-CoA synthase